MPDQVLSDFSNNARPSQSYDTEDTANIYFRYSSDLFGQIVLSRCSPPKTQYVKMLSSSELIEVTSDNFVVTNTEGRIIHKGNPNPIEIDYLGLFCDLIDRKTEMDYTFSPECHLNHLAVIEACYLSKKSQAYINPKTLLEDL